jgi:hypothetical protein
LILDAHIIAVVQVLRRDFSNGLNEVGASVHLHLRNRSNSSNVMLLLATRPQNHKYKARKCDFMKEFLLEWTEKLVSFLTYRHTIGMDIFFS